MVDGLAHVVESKCIGCGLCATGCPEHTIELALRKFHKELPATGIDFLKIVSKEKDVLNTLHELYIRPPTSRNSTL